mmetsp:Transcript_53555/g.154412  ORF Transcript_53555/g.154412 Transcript_53555/m.154412 type:complete len:212 (-) Transcript_53555:16-651(-)
MAGQLTSILGTLTLGTPPSTWCGRSPRICSGPAASRASRSASSAWGSSTASALTSRRCGESSARTGSSLSLSWRRHGGPASDVATSTAICLRTGTSSTAPLGRPRHAPRTRPGSHRRSSGARTWRQGSMPTPTRSTAAVVALIAPARALLAKAMATATTTCTSMAAARTTAIPRRHFSAPGDVSDARRRRCGGRDRGVIAVPGPTLGASVN